MIIKLLKNTYKQFIINEYLKTDEWQLDIVNQVIFTRPRFYTPSADGSLLVQWQNILKFNDSDCIPDCLKILERIVKTEVEHVPNFNFGEIDSFSASKSFGRKFFKSINGSWFRSVSEWGEAMYPTHGSDEYDRKMAALDISDWEDNIRHIEREGFNAQALRIHHFNWLKRYECVNTGGSHHAAMLIYQSRSQSRDYYRNATVRKYSIQTTPLSELAKKGYVAFVTGGMCLFPVEGYNKFPIEQFLKNHICKELHSIDMGGCTPNYSKIVLINERELYVSREVFRSWYERQVRLGNFIPLIDIVRDTLSYCNTPYIHELDFIHLADPLRRSDIALRKKLTELSLK